MSTQRRETSSLIKVFTKRSTTTAKIVSRWWCRIKSRKLKVRGNGEGNWSWKNQKGMGEEKILKILKKVKWEDTYSDALIYILEL